VSGKGSLYVVATPIGNLGDVSRRAEDVLSRVAHVAAEDTRRTRQLLSHLGIGGKTLHRVDAHATEADLDRVLDHVDAGEDAAFATDAGTPAVSDPGSALVARAIVRDLTVVAVPGPSAVLCALVASGLASDAGFRFLGFLPREGPERGKALTTIAETPEPCVLFESPHRTAATLGHLAEILPARRAAVARELTKLHEEIVRGPLAALAEDPREWRGEIVIVLGDHVPEAREATVDDAEIDRRIAEGLAQGLHAKTLAERLAAASGRPKRELYERVVKHKAERAR